MIYIAWFIFFFALVQLIISFINSVSRSQLTGMYEPYNGLISVLIPVRNEEHTIHNILNDLVLQEYQNIEVLVFDDESNDNSVAVIEKHIKLDPRISLIRSTGLPAGWLGKNYACHTLSQHARGEYFLFLDADVRIEHDAILKAVSHMRHYSLGLLSVFPRQIMKTRGEQLTVPVMNYILLSLLPLMLVRISGFSSLAAANGQFMFFKAAHYMALSPHEKLRMHKVEDIAIARYFKKEQITVACMVGDDTIQCRMYDSYQSAIAGFSKNIIAFFGNSSVLAILFWIITTAGIFFILSELNQWYTSLYILIFLLTRVFVSLVSHQNVLRNIVYIVPHQIIFGLLIYKAIINKYSGQYKWKGRSI